MCWFLRELRGQLSAARNYNLREDVSEMSVSSIQSSIDKVKMIGEDVFHRASRSLFMSHSKPRKVPQMRINLLRYVLLDNVYYVSHGNLNLHCCRRCLSHVFPKDYCPWKITILSLDS